MTRLPLPRLLLLTALATALPAERALLSLALPGGLPLAPHAVAKDDDSGGRSGGDDDGGGGDSGGGDDSGGRSGGDDSDGGSSGSDDRGGGDDSGGSGSDDSGGDDDGGDSGGGSDDRGDDDRGDDGDDRRGRGRSGGDDDRGRSASGAAASQRQRAAARAFTPPADSGNDRDGSDDVLAVDLGPAELRRAQALGYTVRERRTLGNLGLTVTRLAPPPGMAGDPALGRLRTALPGSTLAPDDVYRPQGEGCGAEGCWAAGLIGWPSPPEACGRGAVIGLVDTRVELPAVAAAGGLNDRSFVPLGEPLAPSAHGTAVASILIGGAGSAEAGLVPAAKLIVADVFTAERGGGMRAGALQIAAALDWLAGRRPTVINASLAGPDNPVLAAAVARVVARGVPIVAAAGNGGATAPPAYPAGYPGVIAVTAVDRALQPYKRANRGPYVAFAAPGVDLPVPGGGERRSGTSYAAAFVTAAVAALAAQRPLPPAELERRLAATAEDLGDPGRDPVFGWGLIRAGGACARSS